MPVAGRRVPYNVIMPLVAACLTLLVLHAYAEDRLDLSAFHPVQSAGMRSTQWNDMDYLAVQSLNVDQLCRIEAWTYQYRRGAHFVGLSCAAFYQATRGHHGYLCYAMDQCAQYGAHVTMEKGDDR